MYLSLQLCVLISLCSLTVGDHRAYHYFSQSKNWTAAQQFCRTHYTDLVTVNHMAEQKSICANETECRDAWIGLYSSKSPQWLWSQPEQVYKTEEANWKPTGDFNCVCVKKEGVQLYWNTKSCYDDFRFLCYDANNTYKMNTTKTKWLEAQDFCRVHHTDLVSGSKMLNDSDLLSTSNYPGSCWWIGLFRDAWTWSDDSNSSFRNWLADNENTFAWQSNKNKCAKFENHNKWKNVACNEEHPFICYDDHMVLVKKNMTWEEALVYCRRNHGDLAMMTDEHQQIMVQKRAKMADTEFVWVGLFYACFLEEWVWVNGHWVSSDDDNWEIQKKPHGCDVSGAMQKGNKKWVKKNLAEQYNFVCTSRCRANQHN